MSLRGRVQKLEDAVVTAPEPPPESASARLAREEFETACLRLRVRCGGRDKLATGVANDAEARRMAKEARSKFRAYLRATRGGSREQH